MLSPWEFYRLFLWLPKNSRRRFSAASSIAIQSAKSNIKYWTPFIATLPFLFGHPFTKSTSVRQQTNKQTNKQTDKIERKLNERLNIDIYFQNGASFAEARWFCPTKTPRPRSSTAGRNWTRWRTTASKNQLSCRSFHANWPIAHWPMDTANPLTAIVSTQKLRPAGFIDPERWWLIWRFCRREHVSLQLDSEPVDPSKRERSRKRQSSAIGASDAAAHGRHQTYQQAVLVAFADGSHT